MAALLVIMPNLRKVNGDWHLKDLRDCYKGKTRKRKCCGEGGVIVMPKVATKNKFASPVKMRPSVFGSVENADFETKMFENELIMHALCIHRRSH